MSFKGDMNKQMDIILCLGPCCSGKTTYSLEYIKDNPDTIRFSLDEFKLMCFGNLYNDRLDDKILSTIYNLIINLQTHGKNLIVDNFPLDMNYIRLVTSVASTVIIKIFDISYQEAVIRNSVRKKLGGHYVKPTEIARYSEMFDKFTANDDFVQFTLKSSVSVKYIDKINKIKNEEEIFC